MRRNRYCGGYGHLWWSSFYQGWPGRSVQLRNTGLRAGDLIHTLNRTPIESLAQLKSVLAQLKLGDPVVVRIERQGQLQYLAFELE